MKKLKAYLIDLFFTVEFLRYFVSGVIATLVNVFIYMLMSRWLGLGRWYYSDVPAIVLSVLAAYVLNRLWVFRSTSGIWDEFLRFMGSRLLISFVFEYAGIYLVRHILGITTEIFEGALDVGKLFALIFVVLANRVSGKWYVFRDNDPLDAEALMLQAISTIGSAKKFADNDHSERAARLFSELGDPWRDIPAFHVAGTNGKGSITSYLAHILCHAGLKIGWYTSPYLERFNERVRVLDGARDLQLFDEDFHYGEIPDDAIVRLIRVIEKAARRVVEQGGIPPTQFDLMTALAFLWFKEQQCDVMILETGMGGRLDSTNVIQKPLASLIGALGFDHMERLGDTMKAIAGEKAGIIKEGCPVYAYAPEDALISEADAEDTKEVLEQVCLEKFAPLVYVGYKDFNLLAHDFSGQRFRVGSSIYNTKMLAPYQPIYAIMAAKAVIDTHMADEQAVIEGIRDCSWPARMEVILQDPITLLDGAHNLQGCLGLRASLSELVRDTPVIFVLGFLEDKEHKKMLEALLVDTPYQVKGVMGTEPTDPRRFQAEKLIGEARDVMGAMGEGVVFEAFPDPHDAVTRAIALAKAQRAMVSIAGSLYLAGEIRPFVRKKEDREKLS